MARITCKCGKQLSNHAAPNDVNLRVYTDREWEEIFNCDNIQPWMIPLPRFDVWRCQACKRIYVYEGKNQSPVMIYKLEEF